MFMVMCITVMLAVSNSSLVWCMESQPFFTAFPFYQQSTFRQSLNPDNQKEIIELQTWNVPERVEKKHALCKSPVLTKSDYMHALYNKVGNFLSVEHPLYSGLIECVNACKYVKRFDIDEDIMGRFAFQHDKHITHRRSSLFFYMIKHYNVITAVTREIPFKMWSPLAKRLTIIPDIKAHDECSSIELLIKDTNALLLEKIPYYNELISFLHSKQKFEQLPHKSIQCDSGWENQFVYDAFQLLCSNESHDKLYDLVIMLSEAKYKKLIEHETDLGYYALSYEPEMLERMAMGSLTITYDDFFKRKIALLCSCIEKYNNARKDKITPPVELYCIYKTLKPLHIIVPDTFDKDFLNPYKIAFAEYAELLDDIDELYQAYPDAVEDCIKELYPSQLCTIINT